MAGLSINNFWKLKTKLPFRYVAEFYINGTNYQFNVKSFKLPKVEINTDGNVYLGNTNIVMPTFNVATRKIDMTLEETDDFLVTKAMHYLMQKSFSRQHFRIAIHLIQFDEHFHTQTFERGYLCHLSSYDEPSMKRDGSAAPVDINVSFLLDFEGNWDDVRSNAGYYNIIADANSNINIDKLYLKEQNYKTQNNVPNLQQPFTPAMTGVPVKSPKNNGIGAGTKDFTVTDDEIRNVLTKINNGAKDKNGNITEKGNPNVTFEQLKRVQEYNAAKMSEAYNKLQTALNSMGIKISVNAYNDPGHAIGLGTGSGSHLLGQKVDLTFTDANNNKITANNMTLEQKNKIAEAAKAAGLVPNYEASNGQDSFWGDFSLANAMSIDKNGKTVENQQMVSWTKDRVYRTDIKNKNEINYCESKGKIKYQHYAARFAVKEAVFKAFSQCLDDKYEMCWKDIETTNDENGRPKVEILSLKSNKIENMDVSISHCKEYAVANVTILFK